jgi:uncharacterized protein (DUF952 family)
MTTTESYIYKVCAAAEWAAALSSGRYSGSPDDLRDGYIHFSTRAQLAGTLTKHFAGKRDLVLVRVDATRLGDRLKWEPSRGGALFPHLYEPLDVSLADRSWGLVPGADGIARLPEDLA